MIVTLIGYRGCGKTSVGPLLAERLGCPCIDSDDEIEARAGKSIRDIFADDGEGVFRQLETDVLAELVKRPAAVIAAGGGAILAEVNRRRITAAGPVVWLNASAATLAARIGADRSSGDRRPSLTGKSIRREVAEVLEARLPLYQGTAAITVDAESATPVELVNVICEQLTNITAGDKS